MPDVAVYFIFHLKMEILIALQKKNHRNQTISVTESENNGRSYSEKTRAYRVRRSSDVYE